MNAVSCRECASRYLLSACALAVGHCLLLAASAAYLQEEDSLPDYALPVSCTMLESLLSRLHCSDATVCACPDLHQGCSTQLALDSLKTHLCPVPCGMQP